jgi:hypothetical protein
MTTIDLALMRERDPVAFCDWGKALCCQSNKVDLTVTLVSPCMFYSSNRKEGCARLRSGPVV